MKIIFRKNGTQQFCCSYLFLTYVVYFSNKYIFYVENPFKIERYLKLSFKKYLLAQFID
jgi:hypothetical protein